MGTDPKSDGLLFYYPYFKSLIGYTEYTLDQVPPYGPIYGLQYDGGVQFDLHCDGDHIHHPLAYQLQDTVHCLSTNIHGIVKRISIKRNNVTYLIKYISCGEVVERQEHELSDIHSFHPSLPPMSTPRKIHLRHGLQIHYTLPLIYPSTTHPPIYSPSHGWIMDAK